MWWSKFLLAAYSMEKLAKEKRERQPNWTEPEKQLLLSLTRMHNSILENKGSDTMTIKRKSEAWDEIAMNMKAAGYNRSKDRLKQQLGRIRAAEAKRVKDVMERSWTTDQGNSFNLNNNNSSSQDECVKSVILCNSNEVSGQMPQAIKNITLSSPLEHIKIEKKLSIDKTEVKEEKQELSTSTTINNENLASCSTNTQTKTTMANQMRFILHNIQTTNEINGFSSNNNHNEKTNNKNVNDTSNNIIYEQFESAIVPTTVATTSSTSFKDHTYNDPCMILTSTKKITEVSSSSTSNIQQQRKFRIRRMRLTGIHTPSTREQRLRQLHAYRIAVERKRLLGLRIQQKREQILYRQDVQIQNLKLKILRNLANQNRDGNGINL